MKRSTILLVVFFVLCWGTASVQSALVTYETLDGAIVAGELIDARAVFAPYNGGITVTLTNLYGNPKADTALISGIKFSVTGASGSGLLTSVNSGLISTISSGGSGTSGVSDPLTRWKAYASDTMIDLDLWGVGGQPNVQIIGPDSVRWVHGGGPV